MAGADGAASADELREIADLFLLRDDITFLNHGSYGACPRPVFEVYQRWQRELEINPVDMLKRRIRPLLAEARRRLGGYVGADGAHLVFVPNTTFGINIVARSLPLEPGDEVLSTNHEYGAIDKVWRFNCAKRGANYINRPIALPVDDPRTVVDHFWAGVTDRTRIIAVSHVSSFTALVRPVAEICRRARAAGILTVIDGAHVPGQLDLDLEDLGADFYVGNCHKWLCAPKGAGFLYAASANQELLEPLVVGWGWQASNPGSSPFIDQFDWYGTADPAAYLSVPAAIDFLQEHDWPRVQAACHSLLRSARSRVGEITGRGQIAPDSPVWWRQMSSIPIDPVLASSVGRLWEEYRIEAPVVPWNDFLFLRISVQAYNRPEHIETLIEALRALYAGM